MSQNYAICNYIVSYASSIYQPSWQVLMHNSCVYILGLGCAIMFSDKKYPALSNAAVLYIYIYIHIIIIIIIMSNIHQPQNSGHYGGIAQTDAHMHTITHIFKYDT